MICRIKFDDVKPYMRMAKKERVSFINNGNARWYGAFVGDKLVSFFCLVINGNKARFKSNYTLPEYRKQGFLQDFIRLAINLCHKNNVVEMSAFCTPLSVMSHLRNGAVPVSRKGDITFVKYYFKKVTV